MSSGTFLVLGHKAGDFRTREFDGDAAGIAAAAAYLGSNGVGFIYPTTGGIPSLPTLGLGQRLVTYDGGRLIEYNASGAIRPKLNVREFPSFQACHDALPVTGGIMEVPMSLYNHLSYPQFAGSGSTPALTITKTGVTIQGEGRYTTVLRDFGSGAANRDSILVNCAGGVEIKDLTIQGYGTTGTGNLINYFKAATFLTGCLWIENVELYQAPQWAIKGVPDAGYHISRMVMDRVRVSGGMGGPGGGAIAGDIIVGSSTDQCDQILFHRVEVHGPGVGTFGTDALPVGAIHLSRVSDVVFDHNCSFQCPDTSGCLSFANGNDVVTMRDSYIERVYTGSTPVWCVNNGGNLQSFTMSGLTATTQPSQNSFGLRLIKSGANANFHRGRIEHALLSARFDNPTDDIVLGKTTDFIEVGNCSRIDQDSGTYSDLAITGPVLPAIASATTITLSRGSWQPFTLSGTATVQTITASFAGRIVTIILTGASTLSNSGGNIKMAASITGPNKAVTFVCDGTNWYG